MGLGAEGSGVQAGSRYGVSSLLAADLSLTSAAVGTAVSGRLPKPVLAVTELALTAPQVVPAPSEARSRPAWTCSAIRRSSSTRRRRG